MNRIVIGSIWFYSGWTVGAAGAWFFGLTWLVGPVAGAIVLALYVFATSTRGSTRRVG